MKKNILFIFADQLRYDSIAVNGNRYVQTPYLDAYAKDSTVFDHAYSCCPLCSPFRGQLLSGNYSHKNGVMCNEYRLKDTDTLLTKILRDEGYYSAYVGKWHLGYGPYTEDKRYGFDDMLAYNCLHNYYKIDYWHNEKGPYEIREFSPTRETDLAMEVLDNRDAEKPFALVLAWGIPHSSWGDDTIINNEQRLFGLYPQQYDQYDPAEMPVPDSVPHKIRHQIRRDTADYYGMITAMDVEFGRIIQYLKEQDLYDDTVIVFSSDHGEHMGVHGYGHPDDDWLPENMRAAKGTPYEESVHIPLIIKDAGVTRKHNRNRGFIGSVDFLPTILGLCGIEPPQCQGTDYSEAIIETEDIPNDTVYLQNLGTGMPTRSAWVGFWRGIKTERYTYARTQNAWLDGETRLLIDRKHDPNEEHNFINDPAYSEIAASLEKTLLEKIAEYRDPFDTGKRIKGLGMLKLGQELTDRSFFGDRLPKKLVDYLEHRE